MCSVQNSGWSLHSGCLTLSKTVIAGSFSAKYDLERAPHISPSPMCFDLPVTGDTASDVGWALLLPAFMVASR